ncbi:ALP1-like protein [Tanacetum coccineum]|uniref:ALP1-like protein n=1 Tax=Tanacetum coccineum TaxID=301880 RepID=A0ABQ4ZX12_9ASTR
MRAIMAGVKIHHNQIIRHPRSSSGLISSIVGNDSLRDDSPLFPCVASTCSRSDQREADQHWRQRSISALMKCTSPICQLAYGCVPDSLDEYLQMGATTSRDSLRIFCKVIMNLYGEEFLRKPTYTDIEKLYAYHNEKHGFPGMLGSIDCTDWPWANCPVAFKAKAMYSFKF